MCLLQRQNRKGTFLESSIGAFAQHLLWWGSDLPLIQEQLEKEADV